ncbi:MAG TPA: hypothetical protein VN541_15820 [Tepidisphaeraceae bacterium]|nr:hypothetical protein [Tepidisphaeraceae bacterium]
MVALPLLDVVLASPNTPDRTLKLAAQLIHSALTDLTGIEALDGSLASDLWTTFDRQAAALLRGMYERWAQDAELLLERIKRIEQQTGPVGEAESLRHAHGRTRARLSISQEDIEEGLRDALEDRTVPIEEVRRELRLRVQQEGTAAIPGTGTVTGGGNAG